MNLRLLILLYIMFYCLLFLHLSTTSKKLPSCVPKLVICRIQTGQSLFDIDLFVRWYLFLFQTPLKYKLYFRHMLGEALSSLSVKELKSLEIRLEKGISRIRSKKVLILVPNWYYHIFLFYLDITFPCMAINKFCVHTFLLCF
jgi:hypothetical protein